MTHAFDNEPTPFAPGLGGGSGSAGNGPDKIKVGAIPIVDVAPLHLGIAKGFFRDQGMDVEVVNTTGGAAAIPGVVSGQFTFAFGNVTSLIVAKSQNLPLKAVAAGLALASPQHGMSLTPLTDASRGRGGRDRPSPPSTVGRRFPLLGP